MTTAESAKTIHDLASFLEIGIAYGTGYLAFNYFTYRERINSLLNEYLRRFSIAIIPHLSPSNEQVLAERANTFGPTLQFIAECFTNLRLQNRFVSFFYRKPPAADKIIILYLTCINILLLAFVSLSSMEVPLLYLVLLALSPAITIIIASILALKLNAILYEYTLTLDMTYKIFQPYDIKGTSTQLTEHRFATKSTLIALAVYCMEHRDDTTSTDTLKKRLREAEDDPDTGDLIDHHALIRHMRKQLIG